MSTLATHRRPLCRFDSIIVPHDLSGVADRALPIIGRLARRGVLGVRLVTTTSPGLDASKDRDELIGHARRIHGWPVTPIVLETNEPAQELAEFADRHPGALVCLATHARSAIGELFTGSMTDELLHRRAGPVLVVGPSVDPDGVLDDNLIVGINEYAKGSPLLEVADAWRATFGGDVELFEAADSDDAAGALLAAAERTGSIIAVASHLRRGLDRALHGSVAWELVRRSPTPVLVVPASDC